MSTKTFGPSRFTSVGTIDSGTGTGSNTRIGPNGTSSSSINGVEASSYQQSVVGYLDFVSFGGLPANALISKIECRGDASGNASTYAGNTAAANSYMAIQGIEYPGGTEYQGLDSVQVNVVSDPPDSQSYNQELSWEVTFGSEITRDNLVAMFGTVYNYPTLGTWLAVFWQAQSNGDFFDDQASAFATLANWEFIVTYTAIERYSWYIKTTTRIVDGKPIRVIASPDDIVQVTEGDEAPEGYEFYGTSVDYPDGPEYVWWSSDEFYLYYIFSPVSPAITGLPYTWTIFPGTPTCTGCTTVELGELTVLVANASGIYQLDLAATHDQVYVRTGFSIFVEAESVKIPNPFAKTGFIP